MDNIDCLRCDEGGPPLPRAPFRNELGEKILTNICTSCWKKWLEHQTVLINHYGLDPRDAKSREFLYEQVKAVLLGEGDAKDVDTSQEGTISW